MSGTRPARRSDSTRVAIAEHYDLYRDAVFQTRATDCTWDDEAVAAGWSRTDRGDTHPRPLSSSHASGPLTPAEAARHPRHRELPRPHLPHQPLGLRLHRRRSRRRPDRPRRQARRRHRHRRDGGSRRCRIWPKARSTCTCSSGPRRRSTCATTARPIPNGLRPCSRVGSASGWTTSSPSSPGKTPPRTSSRTDGRPTRACNAR